ncbi:hypothetical protein WICMUC_003454 [Wickerhamomyces mucosus]|uniref:Ubiquitin-like modifier-activating enzyme ATG7 n=1 Tax=Wickerhamomyces mucosus TaxID=1378264 RepID=A0A9P8PLR6_9ASCO|nr:hypothetical protein WICMUC_003454 [Wickerhamomyces mucosus]
MSNILKFAPIGSFVDASFFQELSKLKLDEFKLDSTKKEIFATYDTIQLQTNEDPSISLSSDSFKVTNILPLFSKSSRVLPGFITNVNTIEEFKSLDKAKFIKDSANEIYKNIIDKKILQDPYLLNQFEVLSFADLKKFKFYYWIAFPSLYSQWDIIDKHDIDYFSIDNLELVESLGYKKNNVFLIKENQPKPLSSLHFSSSEVEIGFLDSSSIPDKPSRFLQNFLTALGLYGFKRVKVNIYRKIGSYQITLENIELDHTRVSGWERTAQGKLGPKLADLGSLIDPIKLSEQSVDLNLKLMKWRVAPDIDLDIVKNSKVLLLGSGTLGSYVSRALLGWGVRHITFVDNGKVSYSNPVRQPLFNFNDVGELKAKKAAEALKNIFPLVQSEGYELEIPMIGHPVTNDEKQQKDFETLVELIDKHDAIFLLTDSRETRWLPTVIGNSKKKIVINAALGFDSYLVMRHGVEGNLGCYFCNDIVAPTDSLTDRTLDQMCTVTRPGVALLAASSAVELLVSLLQHPRKHYASTDESTVLGKLVHQLRGFLGGFEVLKLEAPAFEHCSGCSPKIIKAYEEEGYGFVVKALNDSKYIEEVSGLAEVHRKADDALAGLEEALGSDDDW